MKQIKRHKFLNIHILLTNNIIILKYKIQYFELNKKSKYNFTILVSISPFKYPNMPCVEYFHTKD